MKSHTERSDNLRLSGESIGYSRQERAMQFAAFDALEICRLEHHSAERTPQNDEFPEMYRGPDFDVYIC